MFLAALCVPIQLTPDSGPHPQLLLSPAEKAVQVSSSSITLEVDGRGLDSVQAETSEVTIPGVRALPSSPVGRGPNRFWVYNVPLLQQENEIRVIGKTPQGKLVLDRVIVSTTGEFGAAVVLRPVPSLVEGTPATVLFDVRIVDPNVEPATVYFDFDGDQTIDRIVTAATPVTKTFKDLIAVVSRVTIRTSSNVLYSSIPDQTPALRILPPSVPDPTLAIPIPGAVVHDLEHDPFSGEIFALDSLGGSVSVFGSSGALQKTIALPGVQNPQGIGLDREQNLYVADTGHNRILRLLKSRAYQLDQDGSFGREGTGPGEFLGPRDVAVGQSDGDTVVFVSDAGNRRIQRFDALGIFEMEFDGSDGTPLALPGALIVPASGGLVAADEGAGRLLLFTSKGETLQAIAPTVLGNPSSLDLDPGSQALVVGDSGRSAVHFIYPNGSLLRTIGLPGIPLAVTVPSGNRPILMVAIAGSEQLTAIPITQDPPLHAPEAVVASFLTAMATSDLNSARAHLTDSGNELLTKMTPETLATLVDDAQSVHDIVIQTIQDVSCSVRASFANSSTPNEFLLVRIREGQQWKISVF